MPSEGWGCDEDVMTVTEDSVCSVLLCRQQEDPPNQEAEPRSPETPPEPPAEPTGPNSVLCCHR
jgi:hypothetical protein